MFHFNERSNGIFALNLTDADGLPVGDTFAACLRATLFGAALRERSTDYLRALVAAFDSATLAQLHEDGPASFLPAKRAPTAPDAVYLLRSGKFARFANGQWRRQKHCPVLAAATDAMDDFSSHAFRLADTHNWFGPVRVPARQEASSHA